MTYTNGYTPRNDDYDTRPERPAHVPENATTFDPYHFDASNHSFVSKIAVAIFLLGIAAVIVQLAR